jgi:hypothetical protein
MLDPLDLGLVADGEAGQSPAGQGLGVAADVGERDAKAIRGRAEVWRLAAYSPGVYRQRPPPLVKAHSTLDRAVDRCYRSDAFSSDRARVEFLFTLYEKLTAPLLPASKAKRTRPGKQQPRNI